MKKIMLVAAVAVLTLSLVGCSKGGSSAKGKKDSLHISVFTIQQREQPPADNKTYKWIEEKFGVTFAWDILVGDKDQKIGLLIASGDLPDLVEVDSEKFQGAGVLRDLKPLVEKHAPNIMKHYSSVWQKMIYQDSEKDAEGNIVKEQLFSLPNYGVIDGIPSDTFYNQNGFWIQKAVLKEFGYPVIKTVDEYFDLLEKYYKKYPTIDGMPTIPFSIITADWEAFNLWNPPNFLAGYPNDGNGHVTLENGKYIYTDNFADENAHRWFKLANGYFNRGLIDPASFTDNRDQYYAKIAQGRVLGMFIQGWQFQGQPEQTLWTAGKDERTYAPLPLVFDNSIRPRYRDQSLPNLQRGYGISVKCSEEKAIKILKFMDEMLKEENQKVLYWGFEGEDWQLDAEGRPSRTQAQRDQQTDPNWIHQNRASLWIEEAPKLEGRMPSGYTRTMDDLPWEYAVSQKQVDVDLWEAYGVGSYAEFVDPNPPKNAGWYPMWQCNPSAEKGGLEEDAAVAMVAFETVQRKYLPMMIMGKPENFEKTWKEYVSLVKPHTEIYNKFMQQELDKRVKAFGGFPEN
ncbi:MAG: extracellular solute-binding protein [Treponema sp.]|jgi:putative aldouronate transport system substrate-binding protein|nr:extracellular solute-binding protein [Treponema sp.]